jgi:ABC-2 type transport system ATP-binding protein
MIKVSNLHKEIEGKNIINNLNFEINDGEFVILLGPNGAGKTTTIKTIVGISKPTSGTINVNGYDIQKNEIEYKKQIGYVPDVPFLYDKLTGQEYLQLVASLWNLSKEKSSKNIDKYLKLFEICDKKDDYIYTYSFGTKQKIALCAALINEPKFLVLDEPLLNLDPIVAKNIKDFLIDYCNRGNTILLSTHILEVAEKLYTKIIILKTGTLVANLDRNTIETKYSDKYNLEDIFVGNILKDGGM